MNILNFSLVAGWVDTLFDDCVLFIKDFAATFGMTYNEANILLFVFIMPLLILYFMALSVINLYVKKQQKSRLIMKFITWGSVIATIIIPFCILMLVIMCANIVLSSH